MSKTPIVAIGEVVEGRYKILRLLGEGGMSTVFLAEHWLIKRRVALKILHSEYASDADMIRRFMNEALAAGTLGHPNIVESTDMGFTKTDVPYIVYEYIEGTLLSDEIYRVLDMGPPRALKIAYQIASALEAAHNAGIVHRDLKSDNVFLTNRGEVFDHVKVLDFGISRFLAASDRTALGASIMGTPEFMAPEQVTSPDTVDKRADIYALGIVMYEMLAGRLPFRLGPREPRSDLTAMHALLHRIIDEPPPPLRCHDGPPGLVEMIVEKMLAKDPAHRYASMKDVQGAIDAFTSMLPRASSSASVDQTRSPELEQLSDQTLSRSLMDPAVLAREVKQLGKRWSLVGSAVLELALVSRSMASLASAIAHVSAIADELDHHPSIVVEHPRLVITIHAYDDKSITVLDLVFAARIEQWLRDNGW
ncbi:MAG: protein kinase [Kofleriaceae bacterium]